MEHLKHFVEVIDRSVETFRTTRESLIETIEELGGDNEGITERKILYKCLIKLYMQGYLTAREYKEIVNEECGCNWLLYMPLDDIVGWDLRHEELRSY